jgi:RNA polymerase sigma-70 factor (ECF subfamily)
MEPIALDPATLITQDHRLRSLARALARDPHAADDLAQETWVAALESHGPIRAAPAWLATVLRRAATRGRRGEERRARLEQHSARPEGEPSTQEILAREEARARVVAALAKLDEPARTTLTLRFLEDLPPRVVARRMQVPVETVRTRTRRALEELRGRLDAKYGARERWLAALAPLWRETERPLPLVPAGLVAAGVLVLAAWWLVSDSSVQESVVANSNAPANAPEPRELQAPSLAVQSTQSARFDLGATPPAPPSPLMSTFGDLTVHVDWSDGSSAEGVVVRVSAGAENPELGVREGATDAQGDAHFEALPAGLAWIDIDRETGPVRTATIAAGEATTFTHRLAAGFDVRGLVTDKGGEPIDGAEILLGHGAALANGPCVARSAADGTFFLRELTQAFLGARAPGFVPSPLEVRFAAQEATLDVHFRLARGAGEVRGRVQRFGSGEPVPDAWVRIGEATPRGEWRDEEEVWGALVRSDAAGEFHVQGLRPGRHPVLARAEGLGAQRAEVEVSADGVTQLTVKLPPEAVLKGRVSDAFGNPLAGQRVQVGPEDGPFTASATSAADGSFRIGSLAVARRHEAWIEDRVLGTTRHEFVALCGATEVWNAVLEAGLEVTGRVLDERGEPRAGWSVRIEDLSTMAFETDNDSTRTAADGSFRFRNVSERAHLVRVSAPRSLFAVATRHGVWPGPEELLFRVHEDELPSARVVGTFLDEAGNVVPEMQVMIVPEVYDYSPILSPDPLTGTIDSGLTPPGFTRVYVRTPGRASFLLGPHALATGETWDLGEVRLAPEGTLLVRLVGDAPAPELELLLTTNFEALFTGDGTERRSSPLRPGTHRLELRGGEHEEALVTCEVLAGQETVVEIPLRRGWRAPVAVRGASEAAGLVLAVRLASGELLEHELTPAPGAETRDEFRLAPGEYPCEARAGGRTATGTLVVEPFDREEPGLVLTLE